MSILLVFIYFAKHSADAFTLEDAKKQAYQYRTTVIWERYYWAAPKLKYKPKITAYYQAAFLEAEKYYAQHSKDPALLNNMLRNDLISLCNVMLDPYAYTNLTSSTQSRRDQKVETPGTSIRKRIWRLYEAALGPDNELTKRAMYNYQNYPPIVKSRHKIIY